MFSLHIIRSGLAMYTSFILLTENLTQICWLVNFVNFIQLDISKLFLFNDEIRQNLFIFSCFYLTPGATIVNLDKFSKSCNFCVKYLDLFGRTHSHKLVIGAFVYH